MAKKRKINPSHSEIPNFYKYKLIIELNPMAAIEYSSCYNSFFMSAKTKADDIFNKMYAYQWRKDSVEYRNAKQCALIAIQLVIEAVDGMVNEDSGYECKSYYEEVRDEITKL